MLRFLYNHHESIIVAILATIVFTGGACIFWAAMQLIVRFAP